MTDDDADAADAEGPQEARGSSDDDTAAATSGARPVGEAAQAGLGITVGGLVRRDVVAVEPSQTLRETARTMHEEGVGSAVVLDDGHLVGIVTERDVLRAAATDADLDATTVEELMTKKVVTASREWEVYEAAAAMSEHGIRHLVVTEGDEVLGVLSVRDVLLAGQRVELSDGNWAVLRDPLTFTVRERRRLQRTLLALGAGSPEDLDVDALIAELVGSWSFDEAPPKKAEAVKQLSDTDHDLLRAAVLDELPYLQRSVQPAPGCTERWR
ncbi:MAG TPA: CBS domain-containing protein [Egibacteraceae bacterium]|nr:CBS domain-containing protein [Egibacteraceae bacterium]